MLDYLGQELYIGDDVTFIQHTNASSILLKGRVIGFTPQMVKLQQLNRDGSVRREILKTPVFIVKVIKHYATPELRVINELYDLLEKTQLAIEKRDLSFAKYRTGAGGCNVGSELPPFIIALNEITENNTEIIEKALKLRGKYET